MKPTVQLADTSTPEGVHLALFAHDGHYFLQVDGVQLMTSFSHGPEEHLARIGCAPFRAAGQPRILLGGLGLGYTLAAASQALPQKRAAFIVAELVPELAQWNQEHLSHLHPGLWEDPRIKVRTAAVRELMREAGEGYHAILLDTANGPETCAGAANDDLYTPDGLRIAAEALKEGGLLAVWSATTDPSLEKRLRNADFDVTRELVPAVHKGKQKRHHVIWLARKGTYQSQHQRRSQ
jgi:spermidine synthase